MRARTLAVPIAVAVAIGAAGCSKYESLGLSGAGSMRVEVEVYKGPLGQPREIQVGELAAVLAESVRALKNWQGVAIQQGRRWGDCSQLRDRQADCLILQDAIESSEEIVFGICQIFPAWVDDAELRRSAVVMTDACSSSRTAIDGRPSDTAAPPEVVLGGTRKDSTPSVEDIGNERDELARRIASIAGAMKSKAFRIADATVHYVPQDVVVRDLLANFGLIVSEYSNQIQARTAVLYEQYADDPREASTLPVSDYLRDSSQTDFIQLFDWYEATVGDEGAMGAPGKLGPQERIRMAERLFADYYWEKINEVYASGQGDVSMAFIKNDIGNWDLKSFSNDPAELLAAYRGAADAALSAVVQIAAQASTGGAAKISDAQQLFNLANQITSGETSAPAATAAGLDVTALHARTAAKLASRKAQFAARAATLQTQLQEADSEVARLSALPEGQEMPTELAAAQTARDVAAARLRDLPAEAALAAREILDDHLAVIAALQEGIAGSAAPAAGAGIIPGIPAAVVPAGAAGAVPAVPAVSAPAAPTNLIENLPEPE